MIKALESLARIIATKKERFVKKLVIARMVILKKCEIAILESKIENLQAEVIVKQAEIKILQEKTKN